MCARARARVCVCVCIKFLDTVKNNVKHFNKGCIKKEFIISCLMNENRLISNTKQH